MVATASYAYHDIFPGYAHYEWFVMFFSAGIAGLGLMAFAIRYLNIRVLAPVGYRIARIFMIVFSIPLLYLLGLFVAGGIMEQVLGDDLISSVAEIMVGASFLLISAGLMLIIGLGIRAMRKGYRPARPFMVGIFFMVVFVGLTPLLVILAPEAFILYISFQGAVLRAQLGVVLQLVFFALGVGQKIKLLQVESAQALEARLAAERDANEKLRQADRMKDEFLANTSHELRTPLNGIIGITESVIEGIAGPVTPEMCENLGIVMHSARRLSGLVNDILDFSKLKHAELDLQTRPIDLAPLVRLVLRVNEALVGDRKLTLHADMPAALPLVQADENRLQQILYNLIGNAVKFTPAGEVRVSAGVKGEMIEVLVRDTGIGIAPEQQERIFQSFEQADDSISREYGGTGLGLAISRRLVELHGGRI